jgi:hypothetical protein
MSADMGAKVGYTTLYDVLPDGQQNKFKGNFRVWATLCYRPKWFKVISRSHETRCSAVL